MILDGNGWQTDAPNPDLHIHENPPICRRVTGVSISVPMVLIVIVIVVVKIIFIEAMSLSKGKMGSPFPTLPQDVRRGGLRRSFTSKVSLGSIRNGFRASVLPPEGLTEGHFDDF